MANENNEIGDVVKKCKILLLDIEGTTTSINFVKDKLFPYAEVNVKRFLDSQWENDDVKEAVAALRKLALEDAENKLEGVVSIPGEDASKEDQIEGLVNSVKWQMATDRKVGALKLLQGLIWKQGYENGDLKGHVYEDVSPALQQWRSVEDHKVYIYSSGSVQAQKLLFGQSVEGDLLPHIDGHFDTAVGAKQEVASYKAIVEKLACKPEEILFLTDILKEAEAARGAGLHVALVSREGNAPLSSEATSAFPLLHSLAQLTVSYKRKTDPQDEQPAKILKTEADKDVKSNSEVQVIDAEKELIITEKNTTEAKPAEVEKMEVETTEEPKVENKEEKTIPVMPITNNITETSEIVETANSKNDHVVVEEIEENSKTAEIIDSSTNNINNESQEKIDDKNKTTVVNTTSEELNATVITEIEELTSDKQPLEEVGEIIEDLEPMVEEPVPDEDMDELRNVGEVLEKECDEILSKVQDVTNLATITVKPLLNPIIEETMETDTADSNDIVDRILDTELEMEMNQNAQVLKTASEIVIIEELKETEVLPKVVEAEDNGNGKSQEDGMKEVDNECNSKKKETCLSKVEVIGSGDVTSDENAVINKESDVQEGNKEILSETNSESISIEITNEKPESAVMKEVSNSMIVESAVTEEVTKEKVDEGILDGSTVLQDPPIAIELTNGKLPEDITMEQITKLIEPNVAPEEMAEVIVKQSNSSKETTGNLETSISKEESTAKAAEESCKTEEKNDKDETDNAVEKATNLSDDIKVTSDNEVLEEKLSQVEEAAVQKNEHSVQEKNTTDNVRESSNMEISAAERKENNEQEKSQSEGKILLETNINEEKRHELQKEVQLNGKATTNGDRDTVINGDPRKDEEMNSRLSSENEKDVVNGSNGEANVEQGQGDSKLEMDMTDIKVKTVSTDESHTDPVEQSTEA